MIGRQQRADHAHPLLDQIDRCATEFQPIDTTAVTLKDEPSFPAQQQARLIDGPAFQSVASIARAA
jgi:hypothetical protein